MKRTALILLLLSGCYLEPKPLPWTGDKTLSTTCDIRGAAVEADGPIYCAALAANIEAAQAVLDIPAGVYVRLLIRVHTHERCLSEVDSGSCTYGHSDWAGDSTSWSPPTIDLNQNGTQIGHELQHLLFGWQNRGGNGDHSSWTDSEWERVNQLAERAYQIVP